jgi:hypothetical protein
MIMERQSFNKRPREDSENTGSSRNQPDLQRIRKQNNPPCSHNNNLSLQAEGIGSSRRMDDESDKTAMGYLTEKERENFTSGYTKSFDKRTFSESLAAEMNS